MQLRLLTYNIHSCIGSDGKYGPERIRDVILAADPDIVALQEVDSSLEVYNGVDQLRFLAESTGMQSVIGPTLRRGYGAYGNALLSRWHLRDVRETDLTYRRFEPRGMLRTIVDCGGRSLNIINTHLGLKWWERKFQVSRMLEIIAHETGPTVLMGDFNEWLGWSGNMRKLKREFLMGDPLKTFPARWPRLSLDRIFVSRQAREILVSHVVSPLTKSASDHLPLLAEVSL